MPAIRSGLPKLTSRLSVSNCIRPVSHCLQLYPLNPPLSPTVSTYIQLSTSISSCQSDMPLGCLKAISNSTCLEQGNLYLPLRPKYPPTPFPISTPVSTDLVPLGKALSLSGLCLPSCIKRTSSGLPSHSSIHGKTRATRQRFPLLALGDSKSVGLGWGPGTCSL